MTLKEKIIEAAYTLFGEKGYDKTSVAEIIEYAGASKGGFYHHFKSKEDILETITFNYIAMIHDHYEEILKDRELSVIDKFLESFYRVNELKVASMKDWDKIKNLYAYEDNHSLLRRMGQRFESETAQFYFNLIKMGVEQGVFTVDYPKELSVLWGREVINFQQMSRKVLLGADVTEEDFLSTLRFNETLINQQLGFEEKVIALEVMGHDYLKVMKEKLKGKVL